MTTHIVQGNALNLPYASGIAQTCVTSPPYYGLRDYGVSGQIGLEQTPAEYVAQIVAVMREVWRVLRDDGCLWLNLGDSYSTGAMNPQPNIGARENRDESRTGAPHRKVPDGYKQKDLLGIPWRVAFALQDDGWYLRSDIIWHKPNPMPESVTDRPTKAHEYVFLLTKQARYFYDAEAVREDGQTYTRKSGGYSSSEYTDAHPLGKQGAFSSRDVTTSGRNARTVWTIATRPYSGAHFATMPPALAEKCILAGSRAGDIVLDPFTGSGTTARVAAQHRRNFIGTELNPAYIALTPDRVTVQTQF